MSVWGRTGLALTVEGEKRGGKMYFQLTQGDTVSGRARSQDSVPSSLLITEEFALLQTCKKMGQESFLSDSKMLPGSYLSAPTAKSILMKAVLPLLLHKD